MGDLPRVSRCPGTAALDGRRRHPGPPRRRPRLRDGRAGRPQRAGQPGGDRRHAGHRARGDPGRGTGVLHLAHHRSPGHRRRAGPGHLRRRGRALRHRRRAGRGRHRCLRAGTGGLGRRAPARRRQGSRLDAPALGQDRPPGDLRAPPGRRRAGAVAGPVGRLPRSLRGGGPPPPPDRRPPHRDPVRASHHPVLPGRHPGLSGARRPGPARRPSSRPHWPIPRSAGASPNGSRRRRPRPRRWRRPTAGPSSWATRPTTSRGPRSRWPAWPPPRVAPRSRWPTTSWPSTRGRACSTSPSSTTPRATSTTCARCCCTPAAALGLSDGGAHTGTICDASMPTFMLTHWTRDRRRGETLAVALHRQEADPRHGAPLRHDGPGHGGNRRAGRPQPDRLRRPLAGRPLRAGRPAGRWPPPAAEGRRVRGHHQEGRGDLRGREADRGASRGGWYEAVADAGKLPSP